MSIYIFFLIYGFLYIYMSALNMYFPSVAQSQELWQLSWAQSIHKKREVYNCKDKMT